MIKLTKVVTGKVVMAYLNVNKPNTFSGTPKYSVCLIIPKSDTTTVNKIRAAILAAYDEGQNQLRGKNGTVPLLAELKLPLFDGDVYRKNDAAFKNAYFVNASSIIKPGAVDANLKPILRTSELYSGIIGRASITFYAFNNDGVRGIACGLNNIQKLANGKPLGGHSRPKDDFTDEA